MGSGREIGFIGLGTMGLPMAKCLLAAGYRVVGRDPQPEAMGQLKRAGGQGVRTAAEAAGSADVTILMLPDISVINRVLDGPEGVLAAVSRDRIVINMSTVSPTENRKLCDRLAQRGVRFVEAPVARGPDDAAVGKLSILVGGTRQDTDDVEPLLRVMGETVLHCGAIGSASAMKLATNYLGISSNIIAGEALALARSFGIDERFAIEFMMQTAAGQGYLGTVYPRKVLAGDTTAGFPIELALKDLKLALGAGEGKGLDMVVGKAIRPCYENAVRDGLGRRDLSALYTFAIRETDEGE